MNILSVKAKFQIVQFKIFCNFGGQIDPEAQDQGHKFLT